MLKVKELRGFTLVELMIIIALLAIVVTIAVPSFTQFIRNNQVQSAADELTNFLLHARSQAITNRKTYVVDLSGIEEGKLSLKQGSVEERTFELEPAKAKLKRSGAGNIEYQPNGTAKAETKISVCFETDGANGYLVHVLASGLTQRHPRGQQLSSNCSP